MVKINLYHCSKFMVEYNIKGKHMKISEYARTLGYGSTIVNGFGNWTMDKKDYTMFILKYGD